MESRRFEVLTDGFHVLIEIFLGGEFEFTDESCSHGDYFFDCERRRLDLKADKGSLDAAIAAPATFK